MGKYDDIKKEIKKLVEQGNKLYKSLCDKYDDKKDYFYTYYEQWYTSALIVVKQLAAHREIDFIEYYKNDKRKVLNSSTYRISDALKGSQAETNYGKLLYSPNSASLLIIYQTEILNACICSLSNSVWKIEHLVQSDIFDNEIDSARHLHKKGFLRAAGAICGVIIEKHFKTIAVNKSIPMKKKSPTISDYNDAFKDSVYDTIEWRKMQRLTDLRNLCDHNKDREPTNEEVQELIDGTDRVIKTIF